MPSLELVAYATVDELAEAVRRDGFAYMPGVLSAARGRLRYGARSIASSRIRAPTIGGRKASGVASIRPAARQRPSIRP